MDTGALTANPRVFDDGAPVTAKLLLSYGHFVNLATLRTSQSRNDVLAGPALSSASRFVRTWGV